MGLIGLILILGGVGMAVHVLLTCYLQDLPYAQLFDSELSNAGGMLLILATIIFVVGVVFVLASHRRWKRCKLGMLGATLAMIGVFFGIFATIRLTAAQSIYAGSLNIGWIFVPIAVVCLALGALLIARDRKAFRHYCKMTFLVPASSNGALNSRLLRRPIQRCFAIFILPTLIAFIIGFVYPFLLGLYRSFCTFTSPVDYHYSGIRNYFKAFSDAGFRHAFGFTALYALVSIIIINVFSFALAYALTQKIRGANLFRTVFFMPNLIGGIVLGYIWKLIFDAILSAAGKQPMLTNSTYGFWGLVILVAWQQIGYMMIIYIAGLQAVPEDMLEAAKIDGANRWQTLWRVTIPNVMPSITICFFLTLTNSFKLFDQNLALTGGSPNVPGTTILKTEMLALHIFNTNKINNKWRGTAQAEAVVFFVLVAVMAIAQLVATRRKEVQQ